jgi:hypothetical protein
MIRPSLTDLYRRFAVGHLAMPVTDIDPLATQIASSPARAELLRLRRELEPASAQLSAEIVVLFNAYGASAAHRRADTSRRAAAGTRRWRVVAAFAATLVAAVVVWGTHRGNLPTAPQNAPQANAQGAPDRIFSGFNERAVATKNAGDEIFRGEFRSDEIFNSRTHDG